MDSTCRGEGEGLNCKTRKQTHCELHTLTQSTNCRARVSSGNYSVGVDHQKQDITAELKAPTSQQPMRNDGWKDEQWVLTVTFEDSLCRHAVLQVVNIKMNFEAWSVIYFPCWKHTQFHDAINVHNTLRCSKHHETKWVAQNKLSIYSYAPQVITDCSQFSLTPTCQLTYRINNPPF